MNIEKFIEEFEKVPSVSGKEKDACDFINKSFGSYFDQSKIFDSNSLLMVKYGSSKNAKKKILLDAHIDRIGFVVSKIYENGYIKCSPVGGIDPLVVYSNEFIIHGKEKQKCVSILKPIHLASSDDDKSAKTENIYFDTGILNDIKCKINIGDIVSFSPAFTKIKENIISSSGLDNIVSIASILEYITNNNSPENDIYVLFSSGEETTGSGIKDVISSLNVDYALVFDAGFSYYEGMYKYSCITEGKGPSVSFADTLDIDFARQIRNFAKNHNFELQEISEPGSTGTNATILQIQGLGIPSAVISIPIKNMHSPNEIVDISDIKKTAKLIHIIDKNIG